MNLRNFLPVAFLLWALPGVAQEPAIRDAWVEEGPPTAKALAAYFTLENGAAARTLAAVNSPDFGRVEMHRTEAVAGSYRMVQMKQIALRAGEVVRLAPGGMHLMLIEPRRPLRDGDSVRLTLKFSGGEKRELTLPVRRDGDLKR
jgi:periplasmic copper chaperone A